MYTYILWTGKSDVWISCYNNYSSENVFVLPAYKVEIRYNTDMDYKKW